MSLADAAELTIFATEFRNDSPILLNLSETKSYMRVPRMSWILPAPSRAESVRLSISLVMKSGSSFLPSSRSCL